MDRESIPPSVSAFPLRSSVLSPVVLLLVAPACRVLGQRDLAAWKAEHGIVDTADTGDSGPPPNMEPPELLCSESWGVVDSSMDDELRYVSAASGMGLLFWFEGPTDLCSMGCDIDWVSPYYFTSNEVYNVEEDWFDLPYRLVEGERVYAYFYVDPQTDDPQGELGTCWVETAAGTRQTRLGIAKEG